MLKQKIVSCIKKKKRKKREKTETSLYKMRAKKKIYFDYMLIYTSIDFFFFHIC